MRSILVKPYGNSNYKKSFILLLAFLLTTPFSLQGQEEDWPVDEILMDLRVSELGVVELPVAVKGQDVFLPVKELFEILQIKSEITAEGIEGFFIHRDSTYRIDFPNNRIQYRQEIFSLPDSDFVTSPLGNYLKADYFGKIFGLEAEFSFRNLSVSISTDKELPVVKQMRLENIRKNVGRVRSIATPDTLIPRSYPLFEPGILDWGVVTTQQSHTANDNRFTLGLGTMFMGGETNLRMNYSSRVPFDSRSQFYQWRHINNFSPFFKQITAGRIQSRATSSLFAPVSGVQLSNSPMETRRSFGSYTLSDYTDPRWTVELYVNNVLVDFAQADASGFYTFEVPLMYGNTNIELRFYGPHGEERVETRLINIPYNFVPEGNFEYTFSAGIVENDQLDRFSRLNLNYGLTKGITFGGGVEYLSDVRSGEFMPFVNSSMRLTSNLLLSGEYMYGVKGDGILSYRSPGNVQIDLNYIKYHKDQTAIQYNYLEERKISLSTPIKGRGFSIFGRLTLNQIIMPATEFTTAQLLLSGGVMGVSTNLTTYGLYNDRVKKPTIYSSLSQTYRLPFMFLFSPQLQYDFSRNKLNNLIFELERPVFQKGFLNIAYENNFLRNSHIFELGLRYTFDFAQTSVSSRIGNRNSSFVESARGSLLFDSHSGSVMARNRSSMSRAAISVIPFLDLNRNGQRDPLEPSVSGLQLKNRYGQVTYNEDRTIVWITELQPYVDMMIAVDPVSLDNIAWRVPNPLISVHPTPNHFQQISVPIEVMGEVAGMVYYEDEETRRGQGRITIQILDKSGKSVAEFLTEGDGFFTHLGLGPGTYTARIDPAQLEELEYSSSPGEILFEIEVSEYGDIVDTLEFTIGPDPSSEFSVVNEGNSEAKETEEPKIPVAPERKTLIDLGARGYYAFSDADENIRLIQNYLRQLGYETGKSDGIYGEKTLRAVKTFQKNTEIRLDGIFGPETLKALQKILRKE